MKHTLSAPSPLSRRALLATIATAPLGAWAQMPTGANLSWIVPQPAGNPTDNLARRLLPGLQRELGQGVVIENLPGAGGALGVNKLLSLPTGTPALLIASQTESILTPLSVKAARYQSDSLRPVLLITRGPYILLARADLPVRDWGEFIALAKQRSPQPLSFGHIGHGSMIHLLGESLARQTQIQLTHVPYKGVPPALQDLIGGQIDLTFVPQSSVRDLAASGKVKVLGSTATQASARLPEAKPLSQLDPALAQFVHGTWGAVFVSRNLPEAQVQRLHQALGAACQDPQFQAQTLATGSDPAPAMSLIELERFYQSEARVYSSMAQQMGLKPE